VPGALCRELPLGTGCAESKRPYAEWVRLSAEAPIPVVAQTSLRPLQASGLELEGDAFLLCSGDEVAVMMGWLWWCRCALP
jgi:hypothetical protein